MPKYRVSDPLRRFAKKQRNLPTPAEEVMWNALRSGRLEGYKFRRQVPVGRYVADFLCLEERLVVEVEGKVHQDPIQIQHDLAREAWLRNEGFTVLKFSNDEVIGRVDGALEQILMRLRLSPSPKIY